MYKRVQIKTDRTRFASQDGQVKIDRYVCTHMFMYIYIYIYTLMYMLQVKMAYMQGVQVYITDV